MSSIDSLNSIALQFSIYGGLVILIVGMIGNILNILVFLSLKTFRENSCAFYLTAMSFLNIGQLITSLLPRILNLWFGIDWSLVSLAYCKIRMYIFQVCILASFTCMCLATIDQFLATCSHIRWQRFCNIKCAHRLVTLFIFIWLLHGIPTLIYQNHTITATGDYVCAITNKRFQDYTTYGYVVTLVSGLPVLITAVFGSLAYHNVTQLAYRAVPVVRRELDKQLTVMVLVQVVCNFFTVIPYIIAYVVALSINVSTASYTYAQIQLARNITITLFYSFFASSFYIYFCVSERFRRQLNHALCGLYIKQRQRRRVTINQTP